MQLLLGGSWFGFCFCLFSPPFNFLTKLKLYGGKEKLKSARRAATVLGSFTKPKIGAMYSVIFFF